MISLIEQLADHEAVYIIAVIAAYVLALLFSLALHEWAHAFVATKQGDDTPKLFGRLSLNPLAHIDYLGIGCLLLFGFGWAKPVPVNPLNFKSYRKGMFLVSIAGIAMNLLLVIVGSFFYVFLSVKIGEPTTIIEVFGVSFFELLTLISFTLAVFNLLPIYPLDGFKIIEACSRGQNKFLVFMQRYGSVIMLVFLLSPLFQIILSFLQSNVLIPLLSLWAMIL